MFILQLKINYNDFSVQTTFIFFDASLLKECSKFLLAIKFVAPKIEKKSHFL